MNVTSEPTGCCCATISVGAWLNLNANAVMFRTLVCNLALSIIRPSWVANIQRLSLVICTVKTWRQQLHTLWQAEVVYIRTQQQKGASTLNWHASGTIGLCACIQRELNSAELQLFTLSHTLIPMYTLNKWCFYIVEPLCPTALSLG